MTVICVNQNASVLPAPESVVQDRGQSAQSSSLCGVCVDDAGPEPDYCIKYLKENDEIL